MADSSDPRPSRERIVQSIRENAAEWNSLTEREADLVVRAMKSMGPMSGGIANLALTTLHTRLAAVAERKEELFRQLEAIDSEPPDPPRHD